MKKPITLEEARERHLLTERKQGIHTFSNGTDWEGWSEGNCLSCRFWDIDCLGELCAFEGASMLGIASPELAEMFGWIQLEKYRDYEPPLRRHGWDRPDQCPFFHERYDDNGEEFPIPPDPDPMQLVLIADPSEDIAGITAPTEEYAEV